MKLLIALVLAVLAGLFDTLPMYKMNVPRFSIYSLFAQWILIGTLIPFLDIGMDLWLTGLIIGTLGMVPHSIIVLYRNPKKVLPTLLWGAGLGLAIGFGNDWLGGLV